MTIKLSNGDQFSVAKIKVTFKDGKEAAISKDEGQFIYINLDEVVCFCATTV